MRPLVLALLCTSLFGCSGESEPEVAGTRTRVYVAVEDDSAIVVLDGENLRLLRTIIVGHDAHVHNVQVAPDGKSVWATVMAHEHEDEPGHPAPEVPEQDQVVVIDPKTDRVVSKIDLGLKVHPAHVVVTPDSRTALVTVDGTNELVRIDVATRTIVGRTSLGHGTGAHGVRVSPDGRHVWVAKMDGRCVVRVDLATFEAQHTDLEGKAVQTAVTGDGKWVFASLYDTKRIARINPRDGAVSYIDLPPDSLGPLQLYVTPDSRTLLTADQGGLDGRPWSDRLFFIDLERGAVDGQVSVGRGAHGVVVREDRAYVTSIEDGSVTAIDLTTRKVVATARVGRSPNGISVWSLGAGTP